MTATTITTDHRFKVLKWEEIIGAADELVARHDGSEYSGVYGIPAGGSPVAAYVGPRLGVRILDHPVGGCLIVDDLIDTGTTLGRFPGHTVDVLFRKPWSPPQIAPDARLEDSWLVFPWEHQAGAPDDAVTRLLQFIGDDPTRPGLIDTPRRVCKALKEMTSGYEEDPKDWLDTTFPNDEGYRGQVVVAGVEFTSLCEHHMLPFSGWATLMYEPSDAIVGLSKLPRMFLGYARRLQVQERLTQQALAAVVSALSPDAAAVAVTASHSCMAIRGVRSSGLTTTVALHGPVERSQILEFHSSQTLGDLL